MTTVLAGLITVSLFGVLMRGGAAAMAASFQSLAPGRFLGALCVGLVNFVIKLSRICSILRQFFHLDARCAARRPPDVPAPCDAPFDALQMHSVTSSGLKLPSEPRLESHAWTLALDQVTCSTSALASTFSLGIVTPVPGLLLFSSYGQSLFS